MNWSFKNIIAGREKTSCNVNPVETISKLGMLSASLKSKEDTDNSNVEKIAGVTPRKWNIFLVREVSDGAITVTLVAVFSFSEVAAIVRSPLIG